MTVPPAGAAAQHHIDTVAKTDGLVAFWHFGDAGDGPWQSCYDPEIIDRAFPLHLKRIGDAGRYAAGDWPYTDRDSEHLLADDGPFGNAVRFNRGYIYGAVEREDFEGTLLDLHGRRPFTIMAWVKFIDARHMVAGIWDEGGWDRYNGRRQAALFAGLFGQKGVIAHISPTGSACYPQSTVHGAQYARCRAIDGQPFEDGRWVAMAMTYDPVQEQVTAHLNGVMTPLRLHDPVIRDVYQYSDEQAVNPFRFTLPIFSPRAFALKYNGYSLKENGVSEHRLLVDLDRRTVTCEQDISDEGDPATYRIVFDIFRQETGLLAAPVEIEAGQGRRAAIPTRTAIMPDDEIRTRLEIRRAGKWEQVGDIIKRKITAGAPFTFGRALGLGGEALDEGSHLYIDGVAVFNRAMQQEELNMLCFIKNVNQGLDKIIKTNPFHVIPSEARRA